MAKKRGKKGSKKGKAKAAPKIQNTPVMPIVPTCEFEAICGKRIHFGQVQFLIKWKDFD